MKLLVVRVHKAEVKVKNKTVADIGKGLVVFVGIGQEDKQIKTKFAYIADKIINLRIFEDEGNKLNFSLKDKNHEILVIPNFTLYACLEKGRRPSFEQAMAAEEAKVLFNEFLEVIKTYYPNTQSGIFGAHMDIDLVMDGPVNLIYNI